MIMMKTNSLLLTIIVLFLIGIFYLTPNVSWGNPKDIITLILQIEAAIIVIILSLSLVAVQIAAQSYSTRVISDLKKILLLELC